MNKSIDINLQQLSVVELRNISKKFGLNSKLPKSELCKVIKLRYYELKKYISYTYISQLGVEGKDGRTFLARNDDGDEYAIKIFKKNKNSNTLEREAKLQIIASEIGISPKIIEYDKDGKYIVMEKLDYTLYELFRRQNGQLTDYQQQSLINIFRKLDDCEVFHGDPNPLNFMCKGKKWYIIDFGFAKLIDTRCRRKYGNTPNMKYMILGLILKLKDIYNECSLEILQNNI